MGIAILTFLYGIGGIITIAGYFPTIRDVWHKKPSANISTYIMRIVTTTITFFYALIVNGDIMFISIVGAQLLAMIIILVLRLRIDIKS